MAWRARQVVRVRYLARGFGAFKDSHAPFPCIVSIAGIMSAYFIQPMNTAASPASSCVQVIFIDLITHRTSTLRNCLFGGSLVPKITNYSLKLRVRLSL